MKKKIILLIILFISVTIFTGCTSTKEITDSEYFKEEYESLNNKSINKHKVRSLSISSDNPFIYASGKEILEKMNNKQTFIVFFGYAKDPYTRSMIETLIKVSNDYNINKIYYVDIENIRDEKTIDKNGNIKTTTEGTEAYYELLNKMDSLLNDYTVDGKSMNEKRIESPTLLAVIDGEPFELTDGISELQTSPYQKLTKEMKDSMYKELECIMKCLSENSNTCQKNAC